MSEVEIFISEPHIVEPASSYHKPLGIILQESALVLPSQIEIALQDQKINSHLKLGEILALRGWLKKETADFFAKEWNGLIKDQHKREIGYYLRRAALLDEKKIREILAEQKKLGVRFGSVAVLRGWVKDKTLEFFLRYLHPQQFSQTAELGKKDTFGHLTTATGKTTKHPATRNKDKSSLERLLDTIEAEDSKQASLFDGAKNKEDNFVKWIG